MRLIYAILFLFPIAMLVSSPGEDVGSLLVAQTTKVAKPAIVFPDNPSPLPLTPTPAPVAGAPVRLTPELWYVVRSDTKLVALSAPKGIVSIVKETGPIRLRGRFADKPGVVETRVFSDKFLYIVEATSRGKCDLIVWPVGSEDEKDAIYQAIESDVGPAPPTPVDNPLQSAWALETGASKVRHRDLLAGMYRGLASRVAAGAHDGQALSKLNEFITETRRALPIADTEFLGVRQAVGKELNRTLPVNPLIKVDEAFKSIAVPEYDRISKLLEALK